MDAHGGGFIGERYSPFEQSDYDPSSLGASDHYNMINENSQEHALSNSNEASNNVPSDRNDASGSMSSKYRQA
jgi:hypothetical protein